MFALTPHRLAALTAVAELDDPTARQVAEHAWPGDPGWDIPGLLVRRAERALADLERKGLAAADTADPTPVGTSRWTLTDNGRAALQDIAGDA